MKFIRHFLQWWRSKCEQFSSSTPEQRQRQALIRSAQRKVARDGSARNVNADEWNALAYEPLKKAMEATSPQAIEKLRGKKLFKHT